VRYAIAIAVVVVGTVFAAVDARADEPPTAARVPIVVVERGRSVDRAEVDAVEQGLGAPAIRGAELARAIRTGVKGSTTVDSARIHDRFTKVRDGFFAGDHAASRVGFEKIVAKIEGDPCVVVLAPELQVVSFESRLYLALIARGDGDLESVERQLAGAARRYLELAPRPTKYPPWLYEAYQRIADNQESAETSAPAAPESCEIKVGDRAVTARVDRADLRVVIAAESGPEDLTASVAEIARAGGWPRVVAAVGRAEGLEVLLIDAGSGQTARTGPPYWSLPADMLKDVEASPGSVKADQRAWYRNGLAWAVTGIGLVAAGTGFALGRVYGTPSNEEPIAWSLMAAGAGVATTGLVLFFVPAPAGAGSADEGLAVGVSGSVRF